MKITGLMLLLVAMMAACTGKKTESSTEAADSVRVDSAVQADVPAPSSLAFSPINGYAVNNTVGMKDSINFILLTSQEELNKSFKEDKSITAGDQKPDFVINYIVAVTCLPTFYATTITMDKVEFVDDVINVYLAMKHGDKQPLGYKPSQIFAIEKRDGVSSMQFFVNGKKDKDFILAGM